MGRRLGAARLFAWSSGVARFTESGQMSWMGSCGFEMRVVTWVCWLRVSSITLEGR
jgi:hypothetical protein